MWQPGTRHIASSTAPPHRQGHDSNVGEQTFGEELIPILASFVAKHGHVWGISIMHSGVQGLIGWLVC